MPFSSLPLYHTDHLQNNWHQSSEHQQQLFLAHNETSASQAVPPPPQSAQSSQGGGGSTMPSSIKPNSMVERARQAQLPLPEPGLKCPRCESTNTKFCYFNNYNLSQPRHFCKTCRRYWTRGGSLRNVPVGGGSRRTAKRSKGKSNTTNNSSNSSNISISSGSILRSPAANASNTSSTSLFLSHNLQNPSLHQLPFLPSMHHHLGNSNPSTLGLGAGGSEMEFHNLLANFEGLRRSVNGMHQFDQDFNGSGNVEFLRTGLGHAPTPQSKTSDMDPQVIDGVASVKIGDSRGVNLGKDFAVLQGSDHHQLLWNTNVWNNSDLSGFTPSNSAASNLLG